MIGPGDVPVEPEARLPLGGLLFPFGLILAVAVLTPTSALFPDQGDVGLYLEKAQAVASGAVPFRDVGFEYPPGALVPMTVPYLLWPFGGIDLDVYKDLFGGWEAVLALALGLVLMAIVRLGGDEEAPSGRSTSDRLGRTALRLGLLSVGAVLALTWRFDLFPTLLMTVALWATLTGRPATAGLALGLGLATKLFPVTILPALALPWLLPFAGQGLAKLALAFASAAFVSLVPFVALAGSDATFQFLRYNAERGLQVESVGGGLALLAGLARGQPIEMNFQFSSVNLQGPLPEAWLSLLPVLTVVGFGLVAWLGWRRARAEAADGGLRSSTAVELASISILMLLATAKVYSIQYVVWLVPFAALLGGRRFWLAAALVGLTMPIHPLLYGGLVEQEALPILVLNLRNALLLALLVWSLVRLWRRAPAAAAVR